MNPSDPDPAAGPFFARLSSDVQERLKKTRMLVIDECNLLPVKVATLLDGLLKCAHQNELPFGGVRLLLVGDFLQVSIVAACNEMSLEAVFFSILMSMLHKMLISFWNIRIHVALCMYVFNLVTSYYLSKTIQF